MELQTFSSLSFSTEGAAAAYIPRVAITLGMGPHSSYYYVMKVPESEMKFRGCVQL